jgi:hypothetical protein
MTNDTPARLYFFAPAGAVARCIEVADHQRTAVLCVADKLTGEAGAVSMALLPEALSVTRIETTVGCHRTKQWLGAVDPESGALRPGAGHVAAPCSSDPSSQMAHPELFVRGISQSPSLPTAV